MAIPFSVPTEENAEENYRQLDFLFEHLLITLREVIRYRRMENTSNNNNRIRRVNLRTPTTTPINPQVDESRTMTAESTTVTEEPVQSRLPLPDIVPTSDYSVIRQKEIEATTTAVAPTATDARSRDDEVPLTWVQVGAELRHIADQFRDTNILEQDQEKNKDSRVSIANVLSFIRPPLGGSIWTLALVLGFGLITRSR